MRDRRPRRERGAFVIPSEQDRLAERMNHHIVIGIDHAAGGERAAATGAQLPGLVIEGLQHPHPAAGRAD